MGLLNRSPEMTKAKTETADVAALQAQRAELDRQIAAGLAPTLEAARALLADPELERIVTEAERIAGVLGSGHAATASLGNIPQGVRVARNIVERAIQNNERLAAPGEAGSAPGEPSA